MSIGWINICTSIYRNRKEKFRENISPVIKMNMLSYVSMYFLQGRLYDLHAGLEAICLGLSGFLMDFILNYDYGFLLNYDGSHDGL